MAEPAFDDWDDEDDDRPRGGPRVGIIVVAVTNFVVAAVALVGAVVLAVNGSAALDLAMSRASLQGLDADRVRSIAASIVGLIALVLFLFGVAGIVAGVGVLKRLAWGRSLALVLGSVAGVLGIVSLVIMLPHGVVPFGAHALVMMLVLNDKDYSYQFR